MRRLLPLLLSVLLLAGCASPAAPEEEGAKRYEATFLTLFDTVTTVVGYAESEEDFQATAQSLHDALLEYHQLYDIYSDYDGVVNLKAVNDAAGGAPVVVDRKIIDLLLFCRDLCEGTGGQVNAALGGVLALWHDAREAGISDPASAALPDAAALAEAARHADFSSVIIDEAASTVQITDPALRLDVGAIAKGYAVEQVCRAAPDGLLLSVGGNVRATGPKPGGENWVVGIQAPDGESGAFLHTLYVRDVSVVTSGDYQRYYTVGGMRYHPLPPRRLLAGGHRAVRRFRPGRRPLHRPVHPPPGGGAGPSGPLRGRGHVGGRLRRRGIQPRFFRLSPHLTSKMR